MILDGFVYRNTSTRLIHNLRKTKSLLLTLSTTKWDKMSAIICNSTIPWSFPLCHQVTKGSAEETPNYSGMNDKQTRTTIWAIPNLKALNLSLLDAVSAEFHICSRAQRAVQRKALQNAGRSGHPPLGFHKPCSSNIMQHRSACEQDVAGTSDLHVKIVKLYHGMSSRKDLESPYPHKDPTGRDLLPYGNKSRLTWVTMGYLFYSSPPECLNPIPCTSTESTSACWGLSAVTMTCAFGHTPIATCYRDHQISPKVIQCHSIHIAL